MFSAERRSWTLAVAAAMITVFGGLGTWSHPEGASRALSPFRIERITLLLTALKAHRTEDHIFAQNRLSAPDNTRI